MSSALQIQIGLGLRAMAKSRNETVHRILDLFWYCEASGLIDIKITRKELTVKLSERWDHLGKTTHKLPYSPPVQDSSPYSTSLQDSLPPCQHSMQYSPPPNHSLQYSPPPNHSLQDSPSPNHSLQDSPSPSHSLQDRPPSTFVQDCSPPCQSMQDSYPSNHYLQNSPPSNSILESLPLSSSLQDSPLLSGSLQNSPLSGSLQDSPLFSGSLQNSPLSGSLQDSPPLSDSLQDSSKPSMSTPLTSGVNHQSSNEPYLSPFPSDCDYDDVQTPDYVPSSTSTAESGGDSHSSNAVRGNYSGCYTQIKTALFKDQNESSGMEEDILSFDSVTTDRISKISSCDENPANESCLFDNSSHDSSREAQHPPSFRGCNYRGSDESDVSTCDRRHLSFSLQTPENMSSSNNESDEEKLGQFFAKITLQQSEKNKNALPSSTSIHDFVVSDSEDINDEEEDDNYDDQHYFLHPPSVEALHTPPIYHTPHIPTTGLMFWGSPDATSHPPTSHHIQTRPYSERKPLPHATPIHHKRTKEEMYPHTTHIQHSLHTERKPLPCATPIHWATPTLGPLTTPSSNKNFSWFKSQMIAELFEAFNRSVFDEKLPPDMEVTWNKKLRTTAGYCYCLGTSSSRTARIELSHKVVDSYDRIRCTLVHEMCHAATWIVDGVRGGGHGSVWKAWAEKVQLAHPGLKPVTRCHAYQIQYKHHYKCIGCNFKFGRHSKSVNLQTTRCVYCGSYLEYVPRLKADGTPMANRKLTRYAAFVKEHYSIVKDGSPWRSHKQVMERLGELYKAEK